MKVVYLKNGKYCFRNLKSRADLLALRVDKNVEIIAYNVAV